MQNEPRFIAYLLPFPLSRTTVPTPTPPFCSPFHESRFRLDAIAISYYSRNKFARSERTFSYGCLTDRPPAGRPTDTLASEFASRIGICKQGSRRD